MAGFRWGWFRGKKTKLLDILKTRKRGKYSAD